MLADIAQIAVVSVVGLVLAIFVVGLVWYAQTMHFEKKAKYEASLKQIATDYGGTFFEDEWLSYAKVEIPWHKETVVIDKFVTGGKSSAHYTRVRIPWPDPNFYLQINVQSVDGAMAEMVGLGDYKVNDVLFDNRYDIALNAPDQLLTVVNPQARALVTQLNDMHGYEAIVWKIESGLMTFMKRVEIIEHPALSEFVGKTLDLYAAASGLKSPTA